MKLRIKFRKYGPVRFIGHLDVMRFFQKAIRRAGIDVAYTGGFSPHQIMSFAAPLGVGLTSDGEYMDIQVHSIISCEDVLERLNKSSVPGIEITGVRILPENAGNAMASVAAASYTVTFRPGKEAVFDMEKAIIGFLAQEEIFIEKKGKNGVRQVNIRPGIYKLEADKTSLFMLTDASSGGNIKPLQILEALYAKEGEAMPEYPALIHRNDTFANIGTETSPHFVPLDQIP